MNPKYSAKFIKRFWSKINKTSDLDGCWNWIGGKDHYGYGQTSVSIKKYKTHRVAYELVHGAIPDGLLVCHHCDNHQCCNPSHLFLGTQADNMRDMDKKGRRVNVPNPGEKNGSCKLTDAQVAEIRRLYAIGNLGYRKLGTLFGISRTQAWRIVTRQSWR